MQSPFDVLAVDPDADEEELKRAYRRRAIETHPDQGGSREEFRRVQEAYERVRNGDVGGARDGTATGRDGDGGRGDGEGSPDRERESRVEYINYEALDDLGWTLDDEDLFEKAGAADLDDEDHSRIPVAPDESLLQAAENCGFTWPYACRGGACANCAVAIVEGEMSVPGDHILPQELIDRGIRLSCLSAPVSDEAKVVYNVKHLPELDDLRLPAYRFERARSD